MNCLELRRAALVDPRRLSLAALAHARNCNACRGFLAQALDFESQLEAELRIPVPRHIDEPGRYHLGLMRTGRLRALAASLAAAIAVAAGALVWPRDDPLALAGIDFVVFEEAQTIVDAKNVDPGVFDRAAVRLDISLPAQLGELRYVCARPFGGGIAYHAVLKTAFGKATLLLLPGRENAARASASARGLQAVVAPATGGSVAIIADSSRSIARIESLIRPRVSPHAKLEWEPGFDKTI